MNLYQIAFIAIIVIITNFAAWRFIKDELGSEGPREQTAYVGFFVAMALLVDAVLIAFGIAFAGIKVVEFFIYLGTL